MLQAAAVFSDNMVLQRNKKILVFGEGDTGSEITVSILGVTVKTRCRGGKWKVYLPSFQAASGAVMRISDGINNIEFGHIAIGEVWLAGGQSNMELELKDADGGIEILRKEAEENVRFYYTPKMAYIGETFYEEERKSHWELFNEEDAAKWSAAAFFFARSLSQRLGVTVGIIGCNWGGTSASAWMSREALLEHKDTCSYMEEYDALQDGKSIREQIKQLEEYQEYQTRWDEKAALIYVKEPMIAFDKIQEICGPNKYPGPMNSANYTRPAGLYQTMLKRVMPYTLKGFIYYQGESDDHKPNSYYILLARLIRQWREDWEDEQLPFITVQLPMHRYQHDPDFQNWCLIREAQMKAYRTIRNTGIAVSIDCGQFHEIHPKNKKPIGERLALQALYNVYGEASSEEAFGPIYRDFYYHSNGMEITFDYAEGGFCLKGEADGFEIAGENGTFYSAKAAFDKDTVFLSSGCVKEPVMARYLWTNYGEVTVYGVNGFPLAPFRTHSF